MDELPSAIPAAAREIPDVSYPGAPNRQQFECRLSGELVGCRQRDANGLLLHEHGLRNGRYHGPWRDWDDDGDLTFETGYVDGLEHGVATQWDKGRCFGAYRMDHGTGVDVWRGDGDCVTETRSHLRGVWHGYERWWLDSRRGVIFQERHLSKNAEHGVFREWGPRGRLRRGFPRYYVNGQRVTKRQYLRAAASDPTLPPFRPEDNLPFRDLPPEASDEYWRGLLEGRGT
jgi:hypothetical protein